jgi:hypothetical protein
MDIGMARGHFTEQSIISCFLRTGAAIKNH